MFLDTHVMKPDMLFHVQKGNSFILYDILNGAELIQIKEIITIFFFPNHFLPLDP